MAVTGKFQTAIGQGGAKRGNRAESNEGVRVMSLQHQNLRPLAMTDVSRRTLLKTTAGGVGLTLLRGGRAAAQDESSQLVVGGNFVIQSLDPGRSIETTTNMINHST